MLTTTSSPERWLQRWSSHRPPRLRLICFPYGGGSPTAFAGWADRLPGDIEVVALRLPGHDSRLREPFHAQWGPLLDDVMIVLEPFRAKPFAFFGHSFGARIAFEVAARWQADGGPMPVRLFLSGCRCPHQANRRPLMHRLPSPAFRARVLAENEHIAQLADAPAIVALIEPLLRAEIGLSELWGGLDKPRLDVPITAMAGDDDPIDPPEKMIEWGAYTTGAFAFFSFRGGHFFLHSREADVLDHVAWQLRPPTRVGIDGLEVAS